MLLLFQEPLCKVRSSQNLVIHPYKHFKMFIYFKIVIFHLYLCVSVCGFAYVSAVLVEVRRGVRSPGSGVTGSWAPPNMGAGN